MLSDGTRLNEFVLRKRLDNGAFGEVWLAENEIAVGSDSKTVAVKIPLREAQGLWEEATHLALLDHPHIVRFYRPGRTSEGMIFLVMEYMPGGPLSRRLREQGRFPEDEAIAITARVLQALEYLHSKGVIHTDIKPSNILLDAAGQAKLADFGIARFIGDKSYVAMTGGTSHYMAPEVWKGKTRKISDLWSVGIVLHELLTGARPFEASTVEHLMHKILSDPPTLAPHLSGEMKAIIVKALEKDVQQRYPSAPAMLEALGSVGIAATPDNSWMRKLEATMSNPHYAQDLNALEGNFDVAKVLNSETILVVTGCDILPELFDRPVAEMLRDAIDRRGAPSPYRRAIIIGDLWWHRDTQLRSHPVISIGGPIMNSLSHGIVSKGQTWELDGLCGSFVKEQCPRVALWGAGPRQTRASVERYIERPDGLSSFLKMCWKA